MGQKPSRLALEYLKELEGIEIGGSAHNPFGLNTKNVDFSPGGTLFKQEEMNHCGEALAVDIVAPGDQLPLRDESQDFVVSSHVIEHFFDPIAALKEWFRVTKPGGYVFLIVPHEQRTFDRGRALSSVQELVARHEGRTPKPEWNSYEHYSVWRTQQFIDLCKYLKYKIVEYQNVDDKVGNGFAVLLKKSGRLEKESIPFKRQVFRKIGKLKRRIMDILRTIKLSFEV